MISDRYPKTNPPTVLKLKSVYNPDLHLLTHYEVENITMEYRDKLLNDAASICQELTPIIRTTVCTPYISHNWPISIQPSLTKGVNIIRDLLTAVMTQEREIKELKETNSKLEHEKSQLQAETDRLKAGRFTKDELHNICHNLKATVPVEEFAQGCINEMQKLYGECPLELPKPQPTSIVPLPPGTQLQSTLDPQFQEVVNLGNADAQHLQQKDYSYGSSWRKRGGVGAFMMLARKWDRLEKMCEAHNYDIFKPISKELKTLQVHDIAEVGHKITPSTHPNPLYAETDDNTVLAQVRDLRRYLFLVESWLILQAKSINHQNNGLQGHTIPLWVTDLEASESYTPTPIATTQQIEAMVKDRMDPSFDDPYEAHLKPSQDHTSPKEHNPAEETQERLATSKKKKPPQIDKVDLFPHSH